MKIFTFTKLARVMLLSAVFVVGAACVSYGDNPSELVGQWVDITDSSNIELFEDGRAIIGKTEVKWKTEGKHFVLSGPAGELVVDYNLSGYELTLVYKKGEGVLVRKDKVEKDKKRKAEEAQKEAQRLKKETEQRHAKISSYFTDTRNGQKYRTVVIGGKKWMAENLNYKTGNSWCYNDDESKCKQYGRLYDWEAAKTACPKGWHLPKYEEWTNTLPGGHVGGKLLKSTSDWSEFGQTDKLGFSALPGGERIENGSFRSSGDYGYWWTASEGKGDKAFYRRMYTFSDEVFGDDDGKGAGFSVRCVAD